MMRNRAMRIRTVRDMARLATVDRRCTRQFDCGPTVSEGTSTFGAAIASTSSQPKRRLALGKQALKKESIRHGHQEAIDYGQLRPLVH